MEHRNETASPSRKPWCVITGASSGIGLELAKLFASDGINLILTATNEGRLKEVAAELKTRSEIEIRTIAADLRIKNSPQYIFDQCRGLEVLYLVNNAGFGRLNEFVMEEVQKSIEMMHVNMEALVELTHRFAQPMRDAGRGRILNVASTAAFQPGPLMAIYYATKAFVFSFSIALAHELKDSGVVVTTLCPGLTLTNFQKRAQIKRPTTGFPVMSARDVALAGYKGMKKGKAVVVPGWFNKVTRAMSCWAPARLSARAVAKINRR